MCIDIFPITAQNSLILIPIYFNLCLDAGLEKSRVQKFVINPRPLQKQPRYMKHCILPTFPVSSRIDCQVACMFYIHEGQKAIKPCTFYSYSQTGAKCELNYCTAAASKPFTSNGWETYFPSNRDHFDESFTFLGDNNIHKIYN